MIDSTFEGLLPIVERMDGIKRGSPSSFPPPVTHSLTQSIDPFNMSGLVLCLVPAHPIPSRCCLDSEWTPIPSPRARNQPPLLLPLSISRQSQCTAKVESISPFASGISLFPRGTREGKFTILNAKEVRRLTNESRGSLFVLLSLFRSFFLCDV